MNLEVGKTYLNGYGKEVTICSKRHDKCFVDTDGYSYTEKGHVYVGSADRKHNLIKEVDEGNVTDNKVKNPKSTHYEVLPGVEAIDIIKQTLTHDEYIGFLKGNVLKYQLRLGKKDNVDKEIIKIKDYTNELKGMK